MVAVDLNCDMGESYGIWTHGSDQELLKVVSSANLACGFHAGDPSTLRTVSAAAVASGVQVGAQVSFPDLAGFGRRAMQIDPGELRDLVLYQIGALDAFVKVAGAQVRYLKPHGALYHVTTTDPRAAEAVVAAAVEYDHRLAILGFPQSALLEAARAAGLRCVTEAFADRAYLPSGLLQPRIEPGSVLQDPNEILERTLRMIQCGEIVTIDGSVIDSHADSICLHSDTPNAVEIARVLRGGLEAEGVRIEPFLTDYPRG
jgi:UPF0271 protein